MMHRKIERNLNKTRYILYVYNVHLPILNAIESIEKKERNTVHGNGY